VTNANDIAALVEELNAFTPPSPMNRAAAALESQARRIAELEAGLKKLREMCKPMSPGSNMLTLNTWWVAEVCDAALSSGKGSV
jgi:hypothetical protein